MVELKFIFDDLHLTFFLSLSEATFFLLDERKYSVLLKKPKGTKTKEGTGRESSAIAFTKDGGPCPKPKDAVHEFSKSLEKIRSELHYWLLY